MLTLDSENHCGDDLSLYHKTPAGNTDAVTRRAGDVEKADPIQQRAAMTHNGSPHHAAANSTNEYGSVSR